MAGGGTHPDRREPDGDDLGLALAEALGAGRVLPWYQPIVDLRTHRVVAVEALARWPERWPPDRGADRLIGLAERHRLLRALDLAVLRLGLADLRRWRARHPELRLAANLSGAHLDDLGTAAAVIAAVTSSGLAPQALELEITESVRPTDRRTASAVVQGLCEAGMAVWIDDFGSGRSTVEDLAWPVTGVKFDRARVGDLLAAHPGPTSRELLAAAQDRGLQLTAEGLESSAAVDAARRLGVHRGQGYVWAAPVPAAGVPAVIASV